MINRVGLMNLRRLMYVLTGSAVVAVLLCVPAAAFAEPDDILVKARSLATNQHRPEALDLLRKHLIEHPRDVDARLLLGAIFSWEGQYQEARSELSRVLDGSPNYTDAILALINVEFWDDHPERALEVAREARHRQPDNTDLVLAEAKALRKLDRRDEAKALLENFLQRQPNSPRAKEMRDDLGEDREDWAVSVDHSNIWFSDHRSSWQEDTYSLKRTTDFGSVFARFHHANQYSYGSNLVELEAYPRIRPGTYAFVSGAFSPDANLYAHYRLAGDVYQSLPHGFEASGGYRLFRFSGNVNMATGSVGKYYGNWLFTLRTFITPGEPGTSESFQLSARRYFGDGERYMTFRYGTGASPFEVRSLNEVGILNSTTFAFDYNRRFRRHWALNFLTGVSREDRVERSGLRQYVLDGTIYYRF
jgi:YaiO family outer membrane protein